MALDQLEGQPRSKVIADSEPILFEQSRPMCTRMDHFEAIYIKPSWHCTNHPSSRTSIILRSRTTKKLSLKTKFCDPACFYHGIQLFGESSPKVSKSDQSTPDEDQSTVTTRLLNINPLTIRRTSGIWLHYRIIVVCCHVSPLVSGYLA